MHSIKFPETGCSCKQQSPSTLRVSEEIAESFHGMYVHSLRKSTIKASCELGFLLCTVWNTGNDHETLHAAGGSGKYRR
jgi:hypothetical protein